MISVFLELIVFDIRVQLVDTSVTINFRLLVYIIEIEFEIVSSCFSSNENYFNI